MGIQGLTSKLEGYSHRTTLSTNEPPTTRIALIDGPALAYHILTQCMNQRDNVISPLDCIPLYADIAAGVMEWLDRLALHGFEMYVTFYTDYSFLCYLRHFNLVCRIFGSTDCCLH